MNLQQLLSPFTEVGYPDCEIQGLQNDSRQVQKHDLFLAYPGNYADGRLYIEQAVSLGACAIVYEPQNWPDNATKPSGIPCIALPNLSDKLAAIAARFYQNPCEKLQVTGVTGTNGKTTIAYQLAQAHTLLGQPAAYVGTIGQGPVDALQTLANTTPDAICLQKLLHAYVKSDIAQVCLEVSSHALCQNRVDGIDFSQAIFTNLTHDHLDYHRTMQAYGEAKARLFAYHSLEYAILNADDKAHLIMQAALQPQVKKITYGLHNAADFYALKTQVSLSGSSMQVQSPFGVHTVHLNALGVFNLYNGLAVFASLLAAGYAPEAVVDVMGRLKAAPGRMEVVALQPATIVDYAHTPDALKNVLETLLPLKQGRLWVVFGCGGDRDTSKRPMMGQIASQYADKVIVTSDNPRNENPLQIIEDICTGISNKSALEVIVDRKEAIVRVLQSAKEEDIVLIAGKGHETYQQVGAERFAFSDREVVKQYYLGV